MKLFKVETPTGPLYFASKKDAKGARNAYRTKLGTVVSRGPDHWRGESFNVAKQTPSSKGGQR